MDLTNAARLVERFAGPGLTSTLSGLEAVLKDADLADVGLVLDRFSVDRDLMDGAALMKRFAGQINVVIHAVGILNGARALSCVLGRNAALERVFTRQYGARFKTVREYYRFKQAAVTIADMADWFPDLAATMPADDEEAV